ncbi:hypothetical protein Rhal01_02621 [Rubritalea halochordaticola]|uniref:Tetratricopeptide repeat protein n=1 Tax=Rubritalea halochordaticola TaxID=714537 RepID=A0ABP9V1A6_9BACT
MKRSMTLLMIALAVCPMAQGQDKVTQERQRRAQQVNAFYNQAYQAYLDGDIAEAKLALKNVFKLNPNHAQSYALKLKLERGGNDIAAQNRKRALTKVIIPRIDFNNLELSLALEQLNALIMKETNNKFTPNFVIHDKSKTLKDKKVTLDVRNFPASEAIRFLTELTNSSVTYEQYSITFRPRGGATEAPAAKADEKKSGFDE